MSDRLGCLSDQESLITYVFLECQVELWVFERLGQKKFDVQGEVQDK